MFAFPSPNGEFVLFLVVKSKKKQLLTKQPQINFRPLMGNLLLPFEILFLEETLKCFFRPLMEYNDTIPTKTQSDSITYNRSTIKLYQHIIIVSSHYNQKLCKFYKKSQIISFVPKSIAFLSEKCYNNNKLISIQIGRLILC